MASRPPVRATLWAVGVYRRTDGYILIHSCREDLRAISQGCVRIGSALLSDQRWTLRLGCSPRHAKGAAVPPEFVSDVMAEMQVIG